ncbi:MAG: hypothetical protein LBB76_10455 [Azoarcus sp.]|jgi:hypothetical protein|nr:hypothetical protein [Azoarcus sp.]
MGAIRASHKRGAVRAIVRIMPDDSIPFILEYPQMNLFIRIKAAGKRRDMLERQAWSVPDGTRTVEALIEYLVRDNVRACNAKTVAAPFFHYLSQQELEDGAHVGKIGFGERKNDKNQDEDEAVRNALQSFADGLYRVLINETEHAPGNQYAPGNPAEDLKEGDTVTFIRLVMLAGRRH